jgi:hypothetical protein
MGSRYSMTLKRDAKSGAFKDRIRLPEDVRLEYQALYGPAWEEKFHSANDTPPDKARAEHAAWAAKVKGRIAALRDSKAARASISHKDRPTPWRGIGIGGSRRSTSTIPAVPGGGPACARNCGTWRTA